MSKSHQVSAAVTEACQRHLLICIKLFDHIHLYVRLWNSQPEVNLVTIVQTCRLLPNKTFSRVGSVDSRRRRLDATIRRALRKINDRFPRTSARTRFVLRSLGRRFKRVSILRFNEA